MRKLGIKHIKDSPSRGERVAAERGTRESADGVVEMLFELENLKRCVRVFNV